METKDKVAELNISSLSVANESSGGKQTSRFLHITYFYTQIFPFVPH